MLAQSPRNVANDLRVLGRNLRTAMHPIHVRGGVKVGDGGNMMSKRNPHFDNGGIREAKPDFFHGYFSG